MNLWSIKQRVVLIQSPFKMWYNLLLNDRKYSGFFIPWALTMRSNWDNIGHGTPWLSFPAIRWLESFLEENMVVFEWGSGGSTIFISKKVKKIVSVEHDCKWHESVSNHLLEQRIQNCELRLAEPLYDPIKYHELDCNEPTSYISGMQSYENYNFENYVKEIDSFEDESFDLIIIDGRARPSCILHSIRKARPGGVIILDDSDRSKYIKAENLLVCWDKKIFQGPGPHSWTPLQTTAWIKPIRENR